MQAQRELARRRQHQTPIDVEGVEVDVRLKEAIEDRDTPYPDAGQATHEGRHRGIKRAQLDGDGNADRVRHGVRDGKLSLLERRAGFRWRRRHLVQVQLDSVRPGGLECPRVLGPATRRRSIQ
jgi:hypothetical protein